QELVGVALLDGLATADPRFAIHLALHSLEVLAAARHVDVCHGRIERLHPVGEFTQIVTVALGDHPAVVHHQESGPGDLHRVTGHGDDGGGACGQAKYLHGHLTLVLAQQVVDGQTFEHVAAGTVHVHCDGT